MAWITPYKYEQLCQKSDTKAEELRQFNIRLNRLIRTDRWINRG